MGLDGFIFKKLNKIQILKQATSKRLPGFFFHFNIWIVIYFFRYETIETYAHEFLPLNISAGGSVVG